MTISNASGAVIATTSLGPGKVAPAATGCVFHFSATVPDSTFYKIEVSHRGQVIFSKAALEANGWQAAVELGTTG